MPFLYTKLLDRLAKYVDDAKKANAKHLFSRNVKFSKSQIKIAEELIYDIKQIEITANSVSIETKSPQPTKIHPNLKQIEEKITNAFNKTSDLMHRLITHQLTSNETDGGSIILSMLNAGWDNTEKALEAISKGKGTKLHQILYTNLTMVRGAVLATEKAETEEINQAHAHANGNLFFNRGGINVCTTIATLSGRVENPDAKGVATFRA